MSQRPIGALAMSRYARESALTAPVLSRLTAFCDLDPGIRIDDFAAASPDLLARIEYLITGWGSPRIGAKELDAMPRLRLIAHAAGSVKHHLDPQVWERGITVSSAADANAQPVAEFTRALIVLALKRAFIRAAEYPTADWPDETVRGDAGYIGRTIGIIGASRTGRLTLDLLRGYENRILLSDPYCDTETAAALGAESVELDELCAQSDVVSIHAPELPQTRHLIDDRRLGLMRDGAVLVNTARGSLVDTDALLRHCETGRIEAILDVTDPEPLPAGHPLPNLPNVLVTPHLAGAQGTEIALLGDYAVAEVTRFHAGEPLRGRVDAEDLTRLA